MCVSNISTYFRIQLINHEINYFKKIALFNELNCYGVQNIKSQLLSLNSLSSCQKIHVYKTCTKKEIRLVSYSINFSVMVTPSWFSILQLNRHVPCTRYLALAFKQCYWLAGPSMTDNFCLRTLVCDFWQFLAYLHTLVVYHKQRSRGSPL